MAKDYATETDIIEIPDAIYAPGAPVKYLGASYTAESFSWDHRGQTWTYSLMKNGIPVAYLEEIPEAELTVK